MFDVIRRLFEHEPPPSLQTLATEANRQERRATDLVRQLDRDHDDEEKRRQRMDPAEAIRRARRLREDQ